MWMMPTKNAEASLEPSERNGSAEKKEKWSKLVRRKNKKDSCGSYGIGFVDLLLL